MRRLILVCAFWALSAAAGAASPQPTDAMVQEARELFASLLARGHSDERIVYTLSYYFGQDFETRHGGIGLTDFYIIRRDPKTDAVTCWMLIGSR